MEVFGHAPDGSPVILATLRNGGVTARVMTWGATLQDLRIRGVDHPLVITSPEFGAYLGPLRYAGAIVGRVANRIAEGHAALDGRVCTFDRNEAGRNTLHGGATGTGVLNWTLAGHDAQSCEMTVTLADGQDGFPGALEIAALYTLGDDGALRLALTARSDAPTFCNMAHHSYWNLDGTADHSHHLLHIPADRYLALDAHKIPLGNPQTVAGTRFDFRQGRQIRGAVDDGIDHCFCFEPSTEIRRLCQLEAGSVRLEIESHEPGLQVYDGRHLSVARGGGASSIGPFAGVALEPQKWPNAPNRPDFASVRLDPGEEYSQVSIYRLSRV